MLLFSFEATELMLPRLPDRMDTDGIAMRGAFSVKFRGGPDGSQLDVEALRVQLQLESGAKPNLHELQLESGAKPL